VLARTIADYKFPLCLPALSTLCDSYDVCLTAVTYLDDRAEVIYDHLACHLNNGGLQHHLHGTEKFHYPNQMVVTVSIKQHAKYVACLQQEALILPLIVQDVNTDFVLSLYGCGLHCLHRIHNRDNKMISST
jgi:uncharacterized cysteine cluster protein YcgN (CxxCxxCC family)